MIRIARCTAPQLNESLKELQEALLIKYSFTNTHIKIEKLLWMQDGTDLKRVEVDINEHLKELPEYKVKPKRVGRKKIKDYDKLDIDGKMYLTYKNFCAYVKHRPDESHPDFKEGLRLCKKYLLEPIKDENRVVEYWNFMLSPEAWGLLEPYTQAEITTVNIFNNLTPINRQLKKAVKLTNNSGGIRQYGFDAKKAREILNYY
jgi:hypothetical protein